MTNLTQDAFSPSVRAVYVRFGGDVGGTRRAVWSCPKATRCSSDLLAMARIPALKAARSPVATPTTNPHVSLIIGVSILAASSHLVEFICRPKSTAKLPGTNGEDDLTATASLLAWNHASAARTMYDRTRRLQRRIKECRSSRGTGRCCFRTSLSSLNTYLRLCKSAGKLAPLHIDMSSPSLRIAIYGKRAYRKELRRRRTEVEKADCHRARNWIATTVLLTDTPICP
jgi:hypothetical protein